jgi:hypothetical protein
VRRTLALLERCLFAAPDALQLQERVMLAQTIFSGARIAAAIAGQQQRQDGELEVWMVQTEEHLRTRYGSDV